MTQKPFDTQKLRHTDPIYTQTLLHTNAYTFTLTPFYIQHQLQFYLGFCTSSLVSCERPHLHTDPLTHKRLHSYTHTLLHPTPVKSQFYLGFCTSSLVSCERVAPAQVKSQFFLRILRIDPHFMRKGCSRTSPATIDHHFVRKGCSRTSPAQVKSQFYLSFCASSLVSCERGLLQDK